LAAEINLAENVFRKDLSPVELAAAVKDVLEKGSMGVEQVAAGLHRSVEWVRRMVGMLDWPVIMRLYRLAQRIISLWLRMLHIVNSSYETR